MTATHEKLLKLAGKCHYLGVCYMGSRCTRCGAYYQDDAHQIPSLESIVRELEGKLSEEQAIEYARRVSVAAVSKLTESEDPRCITEADTIEEREELANSWIQFHILTASPDVRAEALVSVLEA